MLAGILDLVMRQRVAVLLATFGLVVVGWWSAMRLPIDAVPDITNPQIQINTAVPALAPEEVEKLVSFPIESQMAGLPGLVELRSLSKYGLSQVTMTFRDGVDIFRLRQLVTERLQAAREELPDDLTPTLAPIATGLGEIFYYALQYRDDFVGAPEGRAVQLAELRQIQDYLVKPLLRNTPGVAEVNTSGGYERQIVVHADPLRLAAVGLSMNDLADIVSQNTSNAGGGYVEIGSEQLVIRSNSRTSNIEQITRIPLKFGGGVKPITLGEVASVEVGANYRLGASTDDGRESLVGAAIMMAGENSRLVATAVSDRLRDIQAKLPEGVVIRKLYDRSDLVSRTIATVERNLAEGAILVVAVLFALLGNWRAAFIVAAVIPLSMLFAITGMVRFGLSGNLMSLGAIDFGLIIDGSVVMVENIVRHVAERQRELGRRLNARERSAVVLRSAREVARPMFFGVLIITAVYIPILALEGIEGKMFKPMAAVVMLALGGSLVLALVLMPVLCSFLLGGTIREKDNLLVAGAKRIYAPLLGFALRFRWLLVVPMVALFALSLVVFSRLGGEFIPQLDEGDFSLQLIRSSSVSLSASLDLQEKSEKVLRENFPEIREIFSRIGTAELATDPMGPNVADTYVMLKPREEWREVDGHTIGKEQLGTLMRDTLMARMPGQNILVTQPIQMRFNEIMAGARADLMCKIYGESYEELERLAGDVRAVLSRIPGGQETEFDSVGRVPLIEIEPDREEMLRRNVHADDLNQTIEAALAGREAGQLIEGNRRTPIVIRLPEEKRADLAEIGRLPVRTEDGSLLALGQIAKVKLVDQPVQIAREDAQRRVSVLINVRGRDTEGFVEEATKAIRENVKFPSGYYFEFGGQFKNFIEARNRLAVVVPLALVIIFVLIFLSFRSVRQAALIYTGIPLAVTGGVFALWARDMPFSISAGVGFIALSGVAVLNGLMMVSYYNQLRESGCPPSEAVRQGSLTRLRPVLMTALVASLGFVPMALATGAGAEVQRPLATVVIGGIITSTFLTLLVVPALYEWLETRSLKPKTTLSNPQLQNI